MNLREQSDLGSYCLQYRLTKTIKQKREQMTSRDWQYNPYKPSEKCRLGRACAAFC